MPSFWKKNEHIECAYTNIGTIYEITNVERTVIGCKERCGIVLSGARSKFETYSKSKFWSNIDWGV